MLAWAAVPTANDEGSIGSLPLSESCDKAASG